MTKHKIALAALLLGACSRAAPEQSNINELGRPTRVENGSGPTAAEARAQAAAAEKAAPLSERTGPIDPKSAEAAGQIVQHYGALIEERRFRDAAALWTDAKSARNFGEELKTNGQFHLEIGKPGEPEGAAGSIYVTVPIKFYGSDARRGSTGRYADVILRRVNDVPGSTETQRRWHIERIGWK